MMASRNETSQSIQARGTGSGRDDQYEKKLQSNVDIFYVCLSVCMLMVFCDLSVIAPPS